MDISNYLKRRNIFGNSQPEQRTSPFNRLDFGGDTALEDNRLAPAAPAEASTESLYRGILNEPVGAAQKSYRDFIGNAPKKEDFQPNKMSRLAAILAGVSEGAKGRNGYGAARSILDEPYNRAMSEFGGKAGLLKEGADLENEDAKTKLSRFKDIFEANNKLEDNARLDRDSAGRNANWTSQTRARDAEMSTKGYTKSTDMNGKLIYTRVGANGTIEKLEGPKTEESVSEGSSRRVLEAGKIGNAAAERQKSVFDYEQPQRNNAAIAAEAREDVRRRARDGVNQARTDARDSTDANRKFRQRVLAMWEAIENDPSLEGEFDTDTKIAKTQRAKRAMEARMGGKTIDPRIVE